MGLESVPEPARAALRPMAVYNKLPEVGLQDAVDLATLPGKGDQMMSWRDDSRGHFVVMWRSARY